MTVIVAFEAGRDSHPVICLKENTYQSTYLLESLGQMACCERVCIFRFDSA